MSKIVSEMYSVIMNMITFFLVVFSYNCLLQKVNLFLTLTFEFYVAMQELPGKVGRCLYCQTSPWPGSSLAFPQDTDLTMGAFMDR